MIKGVAFRTVRDLVAYCNDIGLEKADIIQIVSGDGGWYLIYG